MKSYFWPRSYALSLSSIMTLCSGAAFPARRPLSPSPSTCHDYPYLPIPTGIETSSHSWSEAVWFEIGVKAAGKLGKKLHTFRESGRFDRTGPGFRLRTGGGFHRNELKRGKHFSFFPTKSLRKRLILWRIEYCQLKLLLSGPFQLLRTSERSTEVEGR